MKRSEKVIRSVIRNIIKENYDTVPSTEGIYTSENKHIAGNLWKLLGCYEEVKDLLEKYTPSVYSKVQSDILLNKIVFGNYGPSYGYSAGIYFGGYNWTSGTDEEDSRLETGSLDSQGGAVSIVNWIIKTLDLDTDLNQLKSKYSGQHVYQQLASANPPNNPPSQAVSGSPADGGSSVNQNVAIGRHCLGTYLSPFGYNEADEFEVETGIRPMTDAARKHTTIFLILFFENNNPVAYHSFPFTDTTHVKNICYNWIDNKKLPNTNTKELNNSQAKDFIALNSLPASELTFVDGGALDQKYWKISGNAKIANAIDIK